MGFNRQVRHNQVNQAIIQPIIGLDNNARHAVVAMLNQILGNEVVLSRKTRKARWNASRASFLSLRGIFHSQFEQLNAISDEIAERVCMLGGLPIGSFAEFLNNSQLEEQPDAIPNVIDLMTDHVTTMRSLRDYAKKCSGQYEDEVTHGFLVDLLYRHEKMNRMLWSCMENETDHGTSQER